MTRAHSRRPGRLGFTLIELLVVIAIIGILVSLTTAAVFKVMDMGPRVQATNEISQLAVSVQNFKTKFGVLPPSRIKLCKSLALYTNKATVGSLDQVSLAFLNQMFPRLDWSTNNIDWSGGTMPGFSSVTLEGDQCLVFFLGGIPQLSPPGCTGFSTNDRNPTQKMTSTNKERIGPFYNFDSARLIQIHASNKFYSYVDVFGPHSQGGTTWSAPYAYFSSGKRTNGYNAFYNETKNSDCATLDAIYGGSTGVWPYAEFMAKTGADVTPPRYQNPDSFQIICAGKDGKFGTGTIVQQYVTGTQNYVGQPLWSSSSTQPMGAAPGNTFYKDDQSNFYDHQLGY